VTLVAATSPHDYELGGTQAPPRTRLTTGEPLRSHGVVAVLGGLGQHVVVRGRSGQCHASPARGSCCKSSPPVLPPWSETSTGVATDGRWARQEGGEVLVAATTPQDHELGGTLATPRSRLTRGQPQRSLGVVAWW
jgi:hypothetical protein